MNWVRKWAKSYNDTYDKISVLTSQRFPLKHHQIQRMPWLVNKTTIVFLASQYITIFKSIFIYNLYEENIKLTNISLLKYYLIIFYSLRGKEKKNARWAISRKLWLLGNLRRWWKDPFNLPLSHKHRQQIKLCPQVMTN